jgi:hypothetical protein
MEHVKPEIEKMQYDLFMAQPVEKRFKIGLQMCENAMKLMIYGVKMEFPHLTGKELEREILNRLKRHNPEKLWWL